MISIFVYGTLKQGYWNHERFCKTAVNIEPAWVWGRLYSLPEGYPGLIVPKQNILATGTTNPIADAKLQNSTTLDNDALSKPDGDWDKIQGELITFANPELDLPPIDRLEGFNTGGWCLYERVLVPVELSGKSATAWVYNYKQEHSGRRVCSGCWDK